MPDTEKKFSELETAASMDGTEFVAMSQNQNGVLASVKATLQALANWIASGSRYASALNTQDKTLTGAINEVLADAGSDVSVTNTIPSSDETKRVATVTIDETQTDINADDTEAILRRVFGEHTVEGNPVTFDAYLGLETVKSLTLTMNPIQDLHGYDHPWVGGAGKNKLNAEVKAATTVNGITGECFSDNRFTISGASTGNGDFATNCDPILVSSGETISITLFGALSFEAGSLFIYLGGKNTNFTAVNQQRTLTFDEDTTIDTVRLRCFNGTKVNGDFKVMIEKGATASTSYAPYENICPISGRDSVDVVVTGKNLFDTEHANWKNGYYLNASDSEVYNSGYTYTQAYTGVKPNVTYTFGLNKTYTLEVGISVCFYDSTKSIIGREVIALTSNVGKVSGSFTTPNGCTYIRINAPVNSNNFQLELGSSATAYEEYKGQTKTITFPSTVYGGTDEIVGGVGTETYGYIASYNGETLPSEWISDRDVYAPNTTPTTGAEVCYELATPTPFSTTPTQIPLNKGNNVVSSDADELELKYSVG